MAYRRPQTNHMFGSAAWNSIFDAGHGVAGPPRSYPSVSRQSLPRQSSTYNRPPIERAPLSSYSAPRRRDSFFNAEPPTGRTPRSHRSTPRPAPPARDPSLDDLVYHGTTSNWQDDDGQGQTLRELQDQQRRSKHRQDSPDTVDWKPLAGLVSTGIASLAAKVISNSSNRSRPTSGRRPSTYSTYRADPSRQNRSPPGPSHRKSSYYRTDSSYVPSSFVQPKQHRYTPSSYGGSTYGGSTYGGNSYGMYSRAY